MNQIRPQLHKNTELIQSTSQVEDNSGKFSDICETRIRARYDALYDKVQRFPKHSEEFKAVAEVPDQQSLPMQITGVLRKSKTTTILISGK